MSTQAERLPGGEVLLAEAALGRLREGGPTGLAAGELRRWLERRADAGDAARALARLEAEGLAAEVAGRWYARRHKGWVIGVVEEVEGEEALVRGKVDRQAVFAVPRRRLRGALTGDEVLLEPDRRARRRGATPAGAVVKVIGRRFHRLVGTLERDEADRRWLVPFNPRVDLEVEVLEAEEVAAEPFVVVELDRPRPQGRHPRGRVVEILGNPAVPGVDLEVVMRHHGIAEQFPAAALAAAAELPGDPAPADHRGREDLRRLPVLTIDGAASRDLDDALSIEPTAADGFRVGVHIADVAHYVAAGGPLDLEAYRRGTSVYYPERAVPMLPERLSSGLCSLLPGVPRLAVSVFLDFDADGRVVRRRFAETLIQSARRMTYDEVRRLLEAPAPGDGARYGPILPALEHLERLMERLREVRRERGSIDFDLPSGDVVLDTDGHTVGILPGERTGAHRIVEELMLAANEAVARELVERGVPALFRVLDPPAPAALADLAGALASQGLEIEGDFEDLPPAALAAVLARAAGRPEEAFVETLVLRAMRRARYSPDCRGHYALATPYYTHFTSPIRRYPDLMVHRVLKAVLAGRTAELTATRLARRLPEIAARTTEAEQRAEASERDLLGWKKVRFLAGQIGETFAGRITGVEPFGLFVQLDELHVDGLVPIRRLSDDFYLHQAGRHRLVGERGGRVFRLGDPVEVVLLGVSERHRGLDLGIAGLREPRRRRRRRSGSGRQ